MTFFESKLNGIQNLYIGGVATNYHTFSDMKECIFFKFTVKSEFKKFYIGGMATNYHNLSDMS